MILAGKILILSLVALRIFGLGALAAYVVAGKEPEIDPYDRQFVIAVVRLPLAALLYWLAWKGLSA